MEIQNNNIENNQKNVSTPTKEESKCGKIIGKKEENEAYKIIITKSPQNINEQNALHQELFGDMLQNKESPK